MRGHDVERHAALQVALANPLFTGFRFGMDTRLAQSSAAWVKAKRACVSSAIDAPAVHSALDGLLAERLRRAPSGGWLEVSDAAVRLRAPERNLGEGPAYR